MRKLVLLAVVAMMGLTMTSSSLLAGSSSSKLRNIDIQWLHEQSQNDMLHIALGSLAQSFAWQGAIRGLGVRLENDHNLNLNYLRGLARQRAIVLATFMDDAHLSVFLSFLFSGLDPDEYGRAYVDYLLYSFLPYEIGLAQDEIAGGRDVGIRAQARILLSALLYHRLLTLQLVRLYPVLS